MQKKHEIYACAKNTSHKRHLKHGKAYLRTFQGTACPHHHSPFFDIKLSESSKSPYSFVIELVFLLAFSAVVHAVLVLDLVWCFVVGCLPHPDKEEVPFRWLLRTRKNPSPSSSPSPSLLQQVKYLICCSSLRNLYFDRC